MPEDPQAEMQRRFERMQRDFERQMERAREDLRRAREQVQRRIDDLVEKYERWATALEDAELSGCRKPPRRGGRSRRPDSPQPSPVGPVRPNLLSGGAEAPTDP